MSARLPLSFTLYRSVIILWHAIYVRPSSSLFHSLSICLSVSLLSCSYDVALNQAHIVELWQAKNIPWDKNVDSCATDVIAERIYCFPIELRNPDSSCYSHRQGELNISSTLYWRVRVQDFAGDQYFVLYRTPGPRLAGDQYFVLYWSPRLGLDADQYSVLYWESRVQTFI